MRILLTGATGYIGKRLLPNLLNQGHEVICLVRDSHRFNNDLLYKNQVEVIEGDLSNPHSLDVIPADIDVAYYLVHSMTNHNNYSEIEQKCAINFREKLNQTQVKQVIYLGGITNDSHLSTHLQSRKTVANELKLGHYHFTVFKAGIIIGSGSASFEIMRDLVEKLPIMITPKWLLTRCQPIGINDVLKILIKSILNEDVYNQSFDIGGNDILNYREMLLQFAEVRHLRRWILIVPVMTPRLSSYWLYFVTSTSFRLARSLVDSMKVEVICQDQRINEILKIKPLCYKEALKKAFERTENNEVTSSWKDSYSSSGIRFNVNDFVEVPDYGCFRDRRIMTIHHRENTLDKIWSIGGDNGWYVGNFLWKIRGHLDKLFGGVGLRRGRRNQTELSVGETLDFWRVLYSNKEEGRLLLFAEMKLPGEAWLEFRVEDEKLIQTATFRPLGLIGRLYWYSVIILHEYIFNGLAKYLSKAH